MDENIKIFHSLLKEFKDSGFFDYDEYAMWYSCDDDPSFSSSKIIALWKSIYSFADGIESFIAADLLRHQGIVEDFVNRMTLPEETDIIGELTSDDELIIFSFSLKKGIRIHFSQKTPYTYRLNFLYRFASYCQSMRLMYEERDCEKRMINAMVLPGGNQHLRQLLLLKKMDRWRRLDGYFDFASFYIRVFLIHL